MEIEKYFKQSDIKVLLQRARRIAKDEQLNNIKNAQACADQIFDDQVDSYYQGIVDHIDEFAKELEIGCIWC
jgi:hypothetical protein